MSELGHLALARRGDSNVLRLTGEFDLSNAWEVEGALVDALRTADARIVVDLSAVAFMDAQLVRTLVKARSAARRADIEFVVVPPTNATAGRVARLMDFDLAA